MILQLIRLCFRQKILRHLVTLLFEPELALEMKNYSKVSGSKGGLTYLLVVSLVSI
jgi:hypothetical protein